MYHFAVFCLQHKQLDICRDCIHVFLSAVFIASYLFNIIQSKLHCSIGLDVGFKYQNFHVHVLLAFTPNALNMCKLFSLGVHHSRLDTLLSSLIQLIWFTYGLLSGFGIKTSAIALCILILFHSPFSSLIHG